MVEGEAFVFCRGTVKTGDSLAPSGKHDGVAVAVIPGPGIRRFGTALDDWSPSPDMIGDTTGIVRVRFMAPRPAPQDPTMQKVPQQQKL